MRKKKEVKITSNISSPLKPASRQFRDRLTRVVSSPIKGKVTNAKQWGRWTP